MPRLRWRRAQPFFGGGDHGLETGIAAQRIETLRAQGNLQLMNRISEPLMIIVGERDRDTLFSRAL